MDKRSRNELTKRLAGFEYRQEARGASRAARNRSARVSNMMKQQGTLTGARKYLNFKRVIFQETVDSVSGHVTLTVPGQIALVYGAEGKFLRSGPAPLSKE